MITPDELELAEQWAAKAGERVGLRLVVEPHGWALMVHGAFRRARGHTERLLFDVVLDDESGLWDAWGWLDAGDRLTQPLELGLDWGTSYGKLAGPNGAPLRFQVLGDALDAAESAWLQARARH